MSAEKVATKNEGKEKEAPRPCWVCLDDGPDESGARPRPTGCACRGGATTHAHVGCLATFAQEKEDVWKYCPTCEQMWSGPMFLALSRKRHELAASLPEVGDERLAAAANLAQALWLAGQYDEALALGRAVLVTMRRVYGPADPDTLRAMQVHASAHADSG
eukprot:COSAG04_NODE_14184_length_577_cov_1.399582_1_plen_160_part_01